MRQIQLTGGFVALVDDEDYEGLVGYRWHTSRRKSAVYACRHLPTVNGVHSSISMHRQIMGQPAAGYEIDHIVHLPGKVLDNRKENLRFVTRKQNASNQRKRSGRSSIFKGVSINRCCGNKWQAHVYNGGKSTYLGTFAVEAHAAYVYDIAAVAAFGEHALTNFPVAGSSRWQFGEPAQ